MITFDDINTVLVLWFDSVARALLHIWERIAAPRTVQLVEQDDSAFRVESAKSAGILFQIVDGGIAGGGAPALAAILKHSRAELVLQPSRFLFRRLELPRRAGEFLDGIVRAQIDRLTPWSPQDVVFGRTAPIALAGDRIVLTVAATARATIAPLIEALTAAGARSVSIATPCEASGDGAPIQIVEQTGRGAHVPRLGHALQVALTGILMLTTITLAGTAFLGGRLHQEQTAIAARISAARVALVANRDLPDGVAAAQRALAVHKRATPSSVITLEALSRVLPDNTYLTELQIAGDKLQMVGLTRNAPALIPLIEQSPHFAHATFFAPTTQPTNDPREHFHIETRIAPIFTPGT